MDNANKLDNFYIILNMWLRILKIKYKNLRMVVTI